MTTKKTTKNNVTKEQKLAFLKAYEEPENIQYATSEERKKYHAYLEELCAENVVEAIRIKAYACYSGNAVYPQNWQLAKEGLLKLVELDEDAYACNSLGYIYYYGRTTDGVPDYENAFKYFSVAALYGIYEAMYKLADLCLMGKGVPMKCLRGAKNIINWLYYQETKPIFLEGIYDGKFADVALRKGRIAQAEAAAKGEAYDEAYKYYLLAKYALELRARYHHFGDGSVMRKLQDSLSEAKKNLSYANRTLEERKQEAYVGMLQMMASYYWDLQVIKVNKSTYKLKFKDSDAQTRFATKKLFLYPELDFCKFMDRATFILKDVKKAKGTLKTKPIYVEECYWEHDWLVLRNEDDFCVKFKAPKLELQEKVKDYEQKEYQVVSIAFQEGGHTYDYLFDLEGETVRIGDKVVVVGYDGETVVEVKNIYYAKGGELPLPFSRYKKVVSVLPQPEEN